MSVLSIILIVLVIILIFGSLPRWPYSTGWGMYPAGGWTLLLLLLIVLLAFRVI